MIDVLRSFLSYVRTDIHAVRRRASDGHWVYKDIGRPVTDDDLRRHLEQAGPHLGVYLMKPGEDTTTIALYDLDDHDGSAGWDRVVACGLQLIRTCEHFKLEPWPVRSGSGNGIHVFFRWDEPQKSKAVRSVLNRVALLSGLHQGASQHGVAADEVDIFPKQDTLAGKTHGALVALPFGRSSAPLSLRLEDQREPSPWLSSAPVREVREETKEERQAAGDAELVRDALQHVPSEDWHQWVRVGIALKGAFGDDGFGLWNDWSSTAGNYAGERGCRMEWNRFNPHGEITLGTLFYLAGERGWKMPKQPSTSEFSDAWCADDFARSRGADFRHVTQSGDWRVFDGSLWRRMDRLEMFSQMKAAAHGWAEGAERGRKELSSSRKHASVVYMFRLCQDQQGERIATSIEDWDLDPWVMGTPAGVLDLNTLEVRPDRARLVSMSAQAAPGGDAPRWRQFVQEVTRGDEEVAAFLQRLAGYCMTGSTEEEKMVILHGPGGNGKSALVETLCWVLGDYGTTLSANAFLMMKGMLDRHPTELAKLYRKRLAIASETSEGARFNTAMIKNLTGGDRIVARFMRQDEFVFDATHKTVLSSNQLPLLGNVDRALERRVCLVRLEATVDRPDPHLKQKLRREAGGIMAWALDGLRAWRERGLDVPASVADATHEYLHSQDDVAIFLADCCSIGPNYSQLSSQLFTAWRSWCEDHGAYVGSAKALTQRLAARGFAGRHTMNGTAIRGLKLGQAGPQGYDYSRDAGLV